MPRVREGAPDEDTGESRPSSIRFPRGACKSCISSLVRFFGACFPHAPHPSAFAQLNPAEMLRGAAHVGRCASKIAPNSTYFLCGFFPKRIFMQFCDRNIHLEGCVNPFWWFLPTRRRGPEDRVVHARLRVQPPRGCHQEGGRSSKGRGRSSPRAPPGATPATRSADPDCSGSLANTMRFRDDCFSNHKKGPTHRAFPGVDRSLPPQLSVVYHARLAFMLFSGHGLKNNERRGACAGRPF